MSKAPPVVTQTDAINDLLKRSNRQHVPIRKTFLQQGTGKVRKAGPLAAILSHRDERALDLYLLIHAVTSAAPFDVTLPAVAWGRLLGLASGTSNLSAVSKALRRIESLKLIQRTRVDRQSKVTLLDEAGSGDPYLHPAQAEGRYLKLTHEYWTGDWHRRLPLNAKVLLLIALSLDDGFYLPSEMGKDWYGISSDTVQRGMSKLNNENLIAYEDIYEKAALSPLGYRTERHYHLKPPFGPVRKRTKTESKQYPKQHMEKK